MRHVHSHSVVYKFLVFFLRDLDDLRLRLKLKIILNLIDFTQLLAIHLSQLSNSAVFVHLVVQVGSRCLKELILNDMDVVALALVLDVRLWMLLTVFSFQVVNRFNNLEPVRSVSNVQVFPKLSFRHSYHHVTCERDSIEVSAVFGELKPIFKPEH